jgi:hypothetical protein
MPNVFYKSIIPKLLIIVCVMGLLIVLFANAKQEANELSTKNLVPVKNPLQSALSKKVKGQKPKPNPANNYGFSELTPRGEWSVRIDVDPAQELDPYVPVIIVSERFYAGKGDWGRQLMIEDLSLKNRTLQDVTGLRLAWIILTTESREAGKNRDAALVQNSTALMPQEWNKSPFKKLNSINIDFVKEAKRLIKGGTLTGSFFIRLRVSEVQFADGSNWREDDQLAVRKAVFAHAPLRAPQPQPTPNCQTQSICFFQNNGQGYCTFDQFSTQFCRREYCNPNEPEACYCNLYSCPSCRDADQDGVYDCEGDCDDQDPDRYPSAGEDCGDGKDNDCDDATDCFDPLCFSDPACGGGCEYDGTGCSDCTPDDGIDWQNCFYLSGVWYGYPTCDCSDPSPIVIDVAGNGIQLSKRSEGVHFDLDSDGTPNLLPWTYANSDDAWLALDRNGNGVIDNGQELFGNFTPQPDNVSLQERNGFLALAEYDKPRYGGNGDGVITPQDRFFSSLRFWQDRNHNGISEPVELVGLQASGVKTLEFDYKLSKKTDTWGNEFRYRAKVRDERGNQLGRWAWDVFLLAKD